MMIILLKVINDFKIIIIRVLFSVPETSYFTLNNKYITLFSYAFNYEISLCLMVIEGLEESKHDYYMFILLMGVCSGGLIYIVSSLLDDYFSLYQTQVINEENALCQSYKLWYRINLLNDDRSLTAASQPVFEYGITWVKIKAFLPNQELLSIVDIPETLAQYGYLVDLVGDFSTENHFLITVGLSRLLQFYVSKYSGVNDYDQLFFFVQSTSLNYSPAAKKYLYEWSQNVLKTHFGSEYSTIGYDKLIGSENFVVDLAQIIVKVFELPFLLNS